MKCGVRPAEDLLEAKAAPEKAAFQRQIQTTDKEIDALEYELWREYEL